MFITETILSLYIFYLIQIEFHRNLRFKVVRRPPSEAKSILRDGFTPEYMLFNTILVLKYLFAYNKSNKQNN